MGARISNIASNITKQYLTLFALALGLGAPISYFLIEALLDMVYPYHIPMNVSGVAFSVLLLVIVLLLTVSTQVRKVSKSNPVDGIRVE